MKKLKVLAMAVCLVMLANESMAQTKIAYVSVDRIVGLMPGTQKIDSLIEKFRVDTIQPEYASLIANYQFKDSVYRDTLHTSKAVRDNIAKELPGYIYQIQNWNQIQQEALQNKQQELLAPIYKEVYDAIKAVSKEKGYTHVFSQEALIIMPDADNLYLPILTKLKIKPPTQPVNPGARP